jgi:sporulation related protein
VSPASFRGRRVLRSAFLCLTAALPLRPSAAQSDPRLVAAVRLAQDGMSDSARAVAGRILAALQPADSLYAEALYTVGLLAATERNRRLELRRVVVDYPQSAWADDALLQLAQLDYVAGNPAAAVIEIDQLLRDYPGSPISATAAFWGARAAGDRHDAATACRMAEAGLATVGSDVELRNQLEFQKQRCQGLVAIGVESTRTDSVTKARADSIARSKAGMNRRVPAGGFYVQVSAVLTQAAAAAESARVKGAGYTPLVLKEGGYLKIRAGRFTTRAEAEAALAQIRTRLGGRPFLVRVAAP